MQIKLLLIGCSLFFVIHVMGQTASVSWSKDAVYGVEYHLVGSGLDVVPRWSLHQQVAVSDSAEVAIELLKTDTVSVSYFGQQDLNILNDFSVEQQVFSYNGQHYLDFLFPVAYKNKQGKIVLIKEFKVVITPMKSSVLSNKRNKNSTSATMSVLSFGQWAKIKIAKTGVYKLTYEDLVGMGFSNPKSVRIFGYGGANLPDENSIDVYDDLPENAIWISKGSDGVFGAGDYILFYAEGSVVWQYDTAHQLFLHRNDLYSDSRYYFVTCNNGLPKEIQTIAQDTGAPVHVFTTFADRNYFEEDKVNLIKSGNMWFGDAFDYRIPTRSYSISLPHLNTSYPIRIKFQAVAHAFQTTTMKMQVNNQNAGTLSLASVSASGSSLTYAKLSNAYFDISVNSSVLNFKLTYDYKAESSTGWIDFIDVNGTSNLSLSDNPLFFRNTTYIGDGNVVEYRLTNAANTVVWDITDPQNPRNISLSVMSSTERSFKIRTDSLKEFVAFNGKSYDKPEFVEMVANQNLHQIQDLDYIIIAPPKFYNEAKELATYRTTHDGLKTGVFLPSQLYNEFSSGAPDVAAIRNFVRMQYRRSIDGLNIKPRYLLLFGDGSYDNKGDFSENTNYILTYQSKNSLDKAGSFVTDDYYALLDDDEGGADGFVDIGVGRFPVSTNEQARDILNKIYAYESAKSFGDWRTMITFVADDEDGGTHLKDADKLATIVDTTYPAYNISKIYLDAYQQVSTPGGEAYPDAAEAVNNKLQQGTFIFNYTGHGGERGLSAEYVITVDRIKQWRNIDNLTLFFTATCEFSRFDDYEYTSAGEHVLLNPKGGAVGLFSTTRLVYSSPNFAINKAFYNQVFESKQYRLGDLIRLAKVHSGTGYNKRNFTLLGDPALLPAYPKNKVVITQMPDTLMPATEVTLKGEVEDETGQRLSDFSGIVYPTVYDKRDTITTLGNDPGSPKIRFSVFNKIIYKGKATVKNGLFTVKFVVPKDISYKDGYGKISLYVSNDNTDGMGVEEKVIIGGVAKNPIIDNQGPDINLYINDTLFNDGGITDENPMMLAYVSDETGINTVGNGIGHDIVATLDDNTADAIVLNEYYEAELDNYKKGIIQYDFSDLEEGEHTLHLKVWDVMNNSSEADIQFKVVKSTDFEIDTLYNYPNPMNASTTFFFGHNRSYETLDVTLKIFNLTGQKVAVINKTIETNGYVSEFTWDGHSSTGAPLANGFYVYELIVRTAEGNIAKATNKLIIVK